MPESNPDSLVQRIDQLLSELTLLKELVLQRRLTTIDPDRCPSPPLLHEGEVAEFHNGRIEEWQRWKLWLDSQRPSASRS